MHPTAMPTTPANEGAADALLVSLDPALVARGRALADAVAPFPMGPALVLAATLLPAVEAGSVSAKALTAACGAEVAQLLRETAQLPRPKPLRGADPTDPGAYSTEGLRRMLLAMVGDARVLVLRLADELVALRLLRDADAATQRAAAQVVHDVYAPLADRLGIGQLKWELEDLAFRYREPEAYRQLASGLAARRDDRERDVESTAAELAAKLAAAGIEAEVAGRPKHIYSIHRKMLRKNLPLERIFDVRAVRVLVADVERCYAALGVVHAAWPPVPGEFDDYVARSKRNGYRSLHTAVIGSDGRPLEVQIRTREMHDHSELGVAAHWRYKSDGGAPEGARATKAAGETRPGASSGLDARLEWLRGLLEGGGEDGDFVARFRAELFDDRIYALTPRGEVVDLPSGATALDFAYHVHTGLGHRCRGAKVDGRMVPLTQPLANGQQVEVLAGKVEEPSRDWLNAELGYLASGRARDKVRAWFRAQDHDVNARAGREVVERELTRLGAASIGFERFVEAFGTGTVDGFLAKVGAGDLSAAQLAGVVQRELGVARAPQVVRPKAVPQARAALEIGGVSDLLYQIARCCRPLPPEPVVGYLTRGRGVTVHRAGCAHLERSLKTGPERAIGVAWGATDGSRFRVSTGLLRDLSTVLAEEGVDITAVQSQARDGTARLTLILQVADLAQLGRALARLERLPGVDAARRSLV
jgi:GTP pyrophosphokinase